MGKGDVKTPSTLRIHEGGGDGGHGVALCSVNVRVVEGNNLVVDRHVA